MKRIEEPEFCAPPDPGVHDQVSLVVHAQKGKLSPRITILIHGLFGRRYDYWGKLPQYLFTDFPDCDIGLYHYKTAQKRIGFSPSVSVEDEGVVLADQIRRLKSYTSIVLVGHSLGGVVAKAAVVSLVNRDFDASLKKISGLILLASPQLGSLKSPSWLAFLSQDARVLKPHNECIRRIDTVFNSRLNLDQNHNPKEKYTIPVWAVVASEDFWVDPLSAGIGIPEKQKHFLRADHGSIKCPSSREDEAYTIIRDCIDSTLKPKLNLGAEEEMSVEDASESDIASIRGIAIDFFGEEVTPEDILSQFAMVEGVLGVVKIKIYTKDEVRVRISGYLCLMPITESTYQDLIAGRIKGSQINMNCIATHPRDAHALYIGAVAAKDYHARPIVMEALRLRVMYAAGQGARMLLTRPVTEDGLRLVHRYKFQPVGSESGLHALYRLPTDALVGRRTRSARLAD